VIGIASAVFGAISPVPKKNALNIMSARTSTGFARPANCRVFDVKFKYPMSFPFPQKLMSMDPLFLLNHHLFASEDYLSRLLVYFLIELDFDIYELKADFFEPLECTEKCK
jgi:hypothetical protein